MKTTKIITALSLALIFAAFISTFAQAKGNAKPPVTYVVTVDNNVRSGGGTYMITVLNDWNCPVAKPQLFQDGIFVYTFVENSPANGILRAATMVPTEGDGYSFDPVKLTGPFIAGKTYFFPVLKPQIPVPGTAGLIE